MSSIQMSLADRAQAALSQGRVAEGIALMEAGLKESPGDLSLWRLYLQRMLQQGQADQALSVLKEVLPHAQAYGELHYYHGLLLCQQGQYTDGIRAFEGAISREYASSELYYNLGLAYQKSQLPALAVEAFEHALQLTPKIPQLYVSLSDALIACGQVAEAEKRLNDALSQFGPAYPLLVAKALLHQGQGAFAEAKVAYLEALRLKSSGDLLNNIGLCEQGQGDYPAAIKSFTQAMIQNPHSLSAYLNLSELWQSGDRFEEALAVVNQGLLARPNDPDLLGQRIAIMRSSCHWENLTILESEFMAMVQNQLAGSGHAASSLSKP